MKILNGLVSILCLVGHVMSQDSYENFDQISEEGRFYTGSSGGVLRGGRSRTADFFNSNLQLDHVAPFRGASGIGGSAGFGSSHSFGIPRGGHGIQEDPHFVRQILGSTVIGREMRMGERGLPRHGGAGIGEQYADGTNNGWDGNPQTLSSQYQGGGWSDPFQGQPIPQLPLSFNGDFGSVRGLFGGMGLPPFRPRF